ncbi:MAG: response regulator [Anaerolineae bacterium]|nr:response regulator [Anaerolineae bacterium]MBN8619060.1 response regulator [Anaerolineae bacterium]
MGDVKKVLVVEDDIHLLEGIRDILELDGFSVLTAENGSQGIEVLQNQSVPPDVIVSDIMMPKMDGIQFLKEVRKETRWFGIPFIFLTAKGERADVHRGMRLGVDDYVIKPYDPNDLLVKIKSRMDRMDGLKDKYTEMLTNLKRSVLTMINHEFRTPLTFVVAYADMLDNPGAQPVTESEARNYIKGISAGAERLRNLIENFILLVELETGSAKATFDWRKGPISSIESIFSDAQERVKSLKERRHVLSVEIEPNLPFFVGDMEYLVVATAQFLNNAAKFSDEESAISMGASSNGNEVVLWVKDNGRGIPVIEHENIWQSFYQIDRAVNEDQGAGAGLAIVRGIAQLHGGRTALESEVGKGSTFKLILPAVEPTN